MDQRGFIGGIKSYLQADPGKPKVKIKSSKDIDGFIRPYFDDYMDQQEAFIVVHLNLANYVKNVDLLSIGNGSGTIVCPKLLFKNTILPGCDALVLVHNHPSSNLKPSKHDIELTKKIKECTILFDILLLDHLIISRELYLSMADEGLF